MVLGSSLQPFHVDWDISACNLGCLVDHDGFVMNAYVTGGTVVTPEDQEAALDYIRHLTFQTPTAEECQTLKIEMIGNFHMSKNSSGDWITIFDAHPVYSLNGGQLAVNPN